MTRTIILNALFILAEYASSTVDAILYRLAIIAIVILLHTLWIWAIVRRARRDGARRALQRARDRAMADQAPLDAQEDRLLLPPVAAAAHRGRW